MASRSAGVLAGHLARAQAVRASWFEYELPPDKIALRPVSDRSSSRLLVVRNAAGSSGRTPCAHHEFCELPEFLTRGSLLVMNDSQVIPARIPMRKASGARAEILLLSPHADTDPTISLKRSVEDSEPWKCIIGGRRIRPGDTLVNDAGDIVLRATVLSRDGTAAVVRFETETPGLSMTAAIHSLGQVPLPPYIRRPADADDVRAYQTVFAESAGSVAAPTAGLHMTEDVMSNLRSCGVHLASVTLHVGAGTFAQLGGPRTGDHQMHAERFAVDVETLRRVAECARGSRELTALVWLYRNFFLSNSFVSDDLCIWTASFCFERWQSDLKCIPHLCVCSPGIRFMS
jgi:S-adenosylmethionine:tRNA ribosyltransferase-isomerase